LPHHLVVFLVGSVVVTVVPGPDMALVTRQVVSRGRRAAQITIFGNLSGLLVHATALAAGLSALIVASATAYSAIKLAGAVYLAYLGIQSIRHARQPPEGSAARTPRGSPYRQGLISTVLNPKPALFFVSYLPQFVDRSGSVALQVAILAAIHVVVGLVWLTIYASLVARMHVALTRPRVRGALERVTGVVLIALAARVAVARR
jgi:threonine/homoserine/homoserine lactone efflux protein